MNSYVSDKPNFFPLQIRTAYEDLLNRLQDLQASHTMAALNSCSLFVQRIGTDEYVYAQGRVADGTTRQVYIAPCDDAGRALKGPGWRKRGDAGQKAMGLSDEQVVHDIDLKDEKFGRSETDGFNALLTGLVAAHPNDDQHLADDLNGQFNHLVEDVQVLVDKTLAYFGAKKK